ncbi:Cytochrome P450 2B11 [Galemys pyrenaicus]|uniref:Cytochrome P450 2B11 n=1 Tax=Galemys pyrenaicus TaxID=202257 RepID=A0A8J6A4E0_GALPY|nr:Cytochrome P450 2B11 [Galemys pyrenaicus]
MLSAVFLLIVLLGLLLLWGQPKSRSHLPPGPWPLPFLGNIFQIDYTGLLKSFQVLREKYGDIFTLYLGSQPAVILCGYKAVREALVDQAEAFSGRGPIAIVDPIFEGTGILFANGKSCKELRRFTLTTMKDFGMGKRSIEERIRKEAQCLVEELRKSQGAYLDPTFLFHSIMANVICSIVFGERFSYQDPRFLMLLHLLSEAFTITSSFYSQEHLNPETVFHEKNFVHTVLLLFFAGTETSSTTLRYGLLILMKHPDILEKVQEEIDRVIGPHRLPALEDRAKMPYTDAVIHEIQRFSSITPLGIPHCVTKDTYFRGYHLPKGTTVYTVMDSILRDPHHFEKPDVFYPGHFLDANGNLRKREAFIPFSMGKRLCVGESLARAELFLFLTMILQNFSLRSPKTPEEIDLTPKECGLGKLPPAFQLCFLPRQGGGDRRPKPSESLQRECGKAS